MESGDDYQSLSVPHESSPPIQHRRLKRLKKTTNSPVKSVTDELLFLPRVDFARLEALESSEIGRFEDSCDPSRSPSEGFDDDKDLSSGCGGLGVDDSVGKETKRALKFDSEADGIVGKEGDLRGEAGETDKIMDVKSGEVAEKVIEEGGFSEKKGNKKRRTKSSAGDPKPKAAYSKKKEEKEKMAHLQQLHAESQRILRETRGAEFKPVPVRQKPISSVLEKIRLRKLEMSKKFFPSNDLDLIGKNDGCSRDAVVEHSINISFEEKGVENTTNLMEENEAACSGDIDRKSDACDIDGLKSCGQQMSNDSAPQMNLDEESTPAFRAPVDDTQDLFADSEKSDGKDEVPSDQIHSPPEEVMAPSWLTMKLKFDSAPDDISDEEDNEKENIDPHPHNLDDMTSSPKGDPVKAFVDDEAEEEDDSDNDLMRYRDDEEDEDTGDLEELNDMIATNYKEKPIDNEYRNELHQKWLEEKDAAGTDDLMRRLNCASKLREAGLLDEEEDDEDEEFISEVEEEEGRPSVARMDTKKAKQMISQMYSDKDEPFLSSDDEETEKRLVKQCLLDKEDQSTLLSPLQDEDSRVVFCLIKKLNIVPETKKKAKPSSFIDTMLTGGNSNTTSKSSFLSRASSHSIPSSCKQGSNMVRSFIFGRDESNSRSSISAMDDSSDSISIENQTTRKVITKFSSSQSRSNTQTTKIVDKVSTETSLFEVLKRSSAPQSTGCNQDSMADLSQSVFAAFKVPKKPLKIAGRI